MGTPIRTRKQRQARVPRAGVIAAVLSGLLLLVAATATPAAGKAVGRNGGSPPDPAPGGPQRPYEPDVSGPRNVDSLAVEVTPDGGGGHGVRVGFDRSSRAEAGGPPAAARRFVFLFDGALRFRPDAFPTCARTVIEAGGVSGCPEGSQVGRGTSHLYPEGTAEVLAFNTRLAGSVRGALVVIPANGTILELTWERVTAPYQRLGYQWALDEIVPPNSIPPDERVGTRRFELSWGAAHNGVSFAETVRRPGAVLRFGLWSEFVTGQVVLPETTAARR